MKYAFIASQQRQHSVSLMCRVLQASRSGYYAWKMRPPAAYQERDRALLTHIRQAHEQNRQAYGYLKTWRALNKAGVSCGKHRVARLHRDHGILARRRRRFIATTHSRPDLGHAPNVLRRRFRTASPNQDWVRDVTFIATREGWLYLAVVIDLYARSVVGWSMSTRNNTALVREALEIAVDERQPKHGLIHHSDRGQTYAAATYRRRLAELGMVSSMSRKGDCWDNAVAESFFATLKFELVDRRVFASRQAARTAIFEYIAVFYNRQRIHQTLGYRTPLEMEETHQAVA